MWPVGAVREADRRRGLRGSGRRNEALHRAAGAVEGHHDAVADETGHRAPGRGHVPDLTAGGGIERLEEVRRPDEHPLRVANDLRRADTGVDQPARIWPVFAGVTARSVALQFRRSGPCPAIGHVHEAAATTSATTITVRRIIGPSRRTSLGADQVPVAGGRAKVCTALAVGTTTRPFTTATGPLAFVPSALVVSGVHVAVPQPPASNATRLAPAPT